MTHADILTGTKDYCHPDEDNKSINPLTEMMHKVECKAREKPKIIESKIFKGKTKSKKKSKRSK